MLDLDDTIDKACDSVPGRLSGALVLVPDGMLIGGFGAGGAFDREPLVRSAKRCLASPPVALQHTKGAAKFTEFAFVSSGQLVVILRGQRYQRVALVLACSREANLAWVLGASRRAFDDIETVVDLRPWEAA
jgi:hypothetical protein